MTSATPQTADAEPATTRRRIRPVAVAAGVVLALALGGSWLLTAHLGVDRAATVAGATPADCTVTLGPGADQAPGAQAGSCRDTVTVTNHGPLPVTVSAALPASLSGPGQVVSGLHAGSADAPAVESLRLGPGEKATVSVETVVPACAGSDGTGTTQVTELGLTTAVGPFTREVVLPFDQVTEVLPADGSTLVSCPG